MFNLIIKTHFLRMKERLSYMNLITPFYPHPDTTCLWSRRVGAIDGIFGCRVSMMIGAFATAEYDVSNAFLMV